MVRENQISDQRRKRGWFSRYFFLPLQKPPNVSLIGEDNFHMWRLFPTTPLLSWWPSLRCRRQVTLYHWWHGISGCDAGDGWCYTFASTPMTLLPRDATWRKVILADRRGSVVDVICLAFTATPFWRHLEIEETSF